MSTPRRRAREGFERVAGEWAMMIAVPDRVDFFVSYTSADRPSAEWIA